MLHVRDQTAQEALSIRHLVASVTKKEDAQKAASEVVNFSNDAQRYLINTLTKSVRKSGDGAKGALLEASVEHAAQQPDFVTLLCDMFEGHASITAESTADFLSKQLNLSLTAQIAALIAISNATGDTCNVGRKALSRYLDKVAKDTAGTLKNWGLSQNHIIALLAVSRTDAALIAGGKAIANEVGAPFAIPKPASLADTAAILSKSISLSKVISELGSVSEDDANALMSLMPDSISPLSVAQSVAYFACPASVSPSDSAALSSLKLAFDVKSKGNNSGSQAVINLVNAVKSKYPSIDWNDVIKALDHSSCRVERFTLIPSAYKRACGQTLPLKHFLGRWSNRQLQGTALRFALTNPELVSRDLPTTSTVPGSDAGMWSNVQFVEAVVNASIADKECAAEIQKAMKEHPYTLAGALLTMPPAVGVKNLYYVEQLIGAVGCDFIDNKFVSFIKQQKRMDVFLSVLCTVAAQTEVKALDEAAPAGTTTATGGIPKRMLEACEVIKKHLLVETALNTPATSKVVVYLVVLCHGSGQIPTNFLAEKLSENNRALPLHPCHRLALAQAIVEVAEELSGKEQYNAAVATALSAFQNSQVGASLPSLAGQAKVLLANASGLADSVVFPEEVDKMAKEYLDSTYRLHQTSSETVDQLELWKKSPKPRDQQVFECVVQILLEETRCLSDYPFKALTNAAILFGQVISRNLIDASKTQSALKIILQMLVKPSDLKVGEYGIIALEQFKNRLPEWPAFAKQLREVVDLDMRIPGVMAIVSNALDDNKKPIDPACLPIPKATGATSQSAANLGLHQHDIRILMDDSDMTQPPQVIQEKMNFLIGNTDPSNIEVNTAELGTLLTPEFYRYFANYLVVKRVSLEPNYHRMYMEVIDRLNAPALENAIRSATVVSIKRLIASDKIRTSSSERSLLKNLGSWLGAFTLSRDRPVYARHIDFKELIYLGLETGKLIAIVPFIAKVLDGAQNSRVFRPQNPWLMGTLSTLMELYTLPDLKITLRFEIEVLCKNLGLKVEDVVEYAKLHPRPPRVPSMNDIRASMRDLTESTDFRLDENTAYDNDLTKSKKLQANAEPYQPRQQSVSIVPEVTPVLISVDTVRAGQEANMLPAANQSQYLQVLAMSLDRGVKELHPHMERSVRIAVTTTRDIVTKDFTRDSDDNRLRRSAQLMSRSLATNLTTATVCETLRGVLRKNLTQLAQRLSEVETEQQTIIDAIIKNNIELCSGAIEYQASELAGDLIEKALAPILEERLHAITKSEFPTIPNDQLRLQPLLSTLPENIHPRGPLHQSHVAVYEHFSQNLNSIDLVDKLFASIKEATEKHYQQIPPTDQSKVLSLTNVSFTETNQSPHHVLVKQKLVEVSQLINERTAVPLVSQMFPRLMALHAHQQSLSSTPNVEYCVSLLLSEVCLFVLQSAREKGQAKAVAELTKLYLKHESRWKNREIAINFIRLSVIDISAFDEALCAALRNGGQSPDRSIVEFAGHVVQRCLIDDKLTTPRDLKSTLQTLEEIAANSRRQAATVKGGPQSTPAVPSRVRVPPFSVNSNRTEDEALFTEWIRICTKRGEDQPAAQEGQPQQNSKQLAMGYVSKLQQQSKLKADGTLDNFIGTLLELSVEEFATVAEHNQKSLVVQPGARPQDPPQSRLPQNAALMSHVDAFSDLMHLLVRCCSWSAPSNAQGATANPEMALIQKILSVVSKVLMNNHDKLAQPVKGDDLPAGHAYQSQFMQQPYVRFFSNLILSLLTGDSQSDETQCVTLILNSLQHLNPSRLPGFAFGWLELVCHRVLLSKALKNRTIWPLYFRILSEALTFIESATRTGKVSNPMLLFFKSFLKLMLILLHDFSEFLLTYHQPLCDAIPTCCVQLRNVVLSAFPKTTKLPDPFQDSLKADALPEMAIAPVFADATKAALENAPFGLAEIQSYCKNKQPANFPVQVAEFIKKGMSTPNGDKKYNVPVLNAVIFFAGVSTLELSNNRVSDRFNESPIVDLLIQLIKNVENEGRYLLLNACVNQLRYPNSHTHLFSCLVLHLFDFDRYGSSMLQEMVQEQITRTIVERLIISRPHPWGLLITFIELAKNPAHKLWDKNFIRCTPDIEKMFTTVGKSINSGPAATAN